MSIRKTVIILFFLLTALIPAHSQLYSNMREVFAEAESFLLFEEYNEALYLYRKLLADNPENYYVMYRIGQCYLNIPGEKGRAVEYLEKAAENTDQSIIRLRPAYRTTEAPPDAIFYLGNAYHVNYRFGEALETYQRFMEVMDERIYDPGVVEEHIKASENALESTKNPVFFNKKRLGDHINTGFSETNPVVSGDETTLVFTRELPFYDAIFMSLKENGEWGPPVEITPQLGCEGDCYPTALSYDAGELYLYKTDDYIGNIYVSRYTEEGWTTIRKLNQNINTGHWESHASVTKDGKTLYFTSNRPGGYGGLDIYKSHRNENGEWGRAVNLGKPVNTPYNEETPFITEDGNTLYFSSHGHFNIGGYNVFYSVRLDDNEWSVPLSAGYGINTPEDDIFFQPVQNGKYAYMSRVNYDLEGTPPDIFHYEIFSETHPRKFRLSGVMSLTGNLSVTAMARVHAIDSNTGDTVATTTPGAAGGWEMEVEPGEYKIVFEDRNYRTQARRLILREDQEESEIIIGSLLVREYELPDYLLSHTDVPEIDHELNIPEKPENERPRIPFAAEEPVATDTAQSEMPERTSVITEDTAAKGEETTSPEEEKRETGRDIDSGGEGKNHTIYLLLILVLVLAYIAKNRFYPRSRR